MNHFQSATHVPRVFDSMGSFSGFTLYFLMCSDLHGYLAEVDPGKSGVWSVPNGAFARAWNYSPGILLFFGTLMQSRNIQILFPDPSPDSAYFYFFMSHRAQAPHHQCRQLL